MTPQSLVELLRSCRPQRIFQVLEPGLPGAGNFLSMTAGPRLMLCPQGRRHCLVHINGRPQTLWLDPTCAMVLIPGAAVVTSPDTPFVSIGSVVTSDGGRLTVGRHPTARNPNHGGRPSLFLQSHHFDATSARELGDLLGACLHRPRAEGDPLLCQAVAAAVTLLTEGLGAVRATVDDQASRLAALAAFIRAHPDHDLSRDQVATHLGCHPNHLARLFQRELGCSFRDYVIRARLDRARELRRDPTLSLEHIAILCGWARASTLIAHHRRVFGTTPHAAGRRD